MELRTCFKEEGKDTVDLHTHHSTSRHRIGDLYSICNKKNLSVVVLASFNYKKLSIKKEVI